jgi:uncharacterized protein YmfQ (DUF2313 family)
MAGSQDKTVADHAAALQALLPTGAVWPRETDAGLTKVVWGVAAIVARARTRALALMVDAFPATSYELLPEWEATLGLPDPCAGAAPTLQLRRAQVVARLTAQGGQSAGYYVAQAAALGYTITIREYAPARMGVMRLGDRMRDAQWAHVWAIQAPQTTVTSFRLGMSGMGERFRSWGNDVLECQMRSLAPAHTTLLFQYS